MVVEKVFGGNPLKHGVAGAVTLIQNSQLLKEILEILNEIFSFIIVLQIAFTVLSIGLFLNSGRISTKKNCNFLVPQRVKTAMQIELLF